MSVPRILQLHSGLLLGSGMLSNVSRDCELGSLPSRHHNHPRSSRFCAVVGASVVYSTESVRSSAGGIEMGQRQWTPRTCIGTDWPYMDTEVVKGTLGVLVCFQTGRHRLAGAGRGTNRIACEARCRWPNCVPLHCRRMGSCWAWARRPWAGPLTLM